jgi:hypothetical protein
MDGDAMSDHSKTDVEKLSEAIGEFERNLPGFWWTVTQRSFGAAASCGVDMEGVQKELLEGVDLRHPFDKGFHSATRKGKPHEALRDVMRKALEFMEANP